MRRAEATTWGVRALVLSTMLLQTVALAQDDYDGLVEYVSAVPYELSFAGPDMSEESCSRFLAALRNEAGAVELLSPDRRFESLQEVPAELLKYNEAFTDRHYEYNYLYKATRRLRYFAVDVDFDGAVEHIFIGENLHTEVDAVPRWIGTSVSIFRDEELAHYYRRTFFDSSRFNIPLGRDTNHWNGVLKFEGDYYFFIVNEYDWDRKHESIALHNITRPSRTVSCRFWIAG